MTNPSQPQEPFKRKPSNGYMKFSALGIQVVLIVAAGTLIGYELDTNVVKNGSKWFTLGFSMLFVILAMVFMIRQLTKKDD